MRYLFQFLTIVPPQQQPKKHKITSVTAALMLGTALLFDGLQFGTDLLHALPIIGTVAQSIADLLISVWAWLTFYVWFKLNGITFINPKRAVMLNGGAFLEMIPVINTLPAWTLAVFLLIGTTRAEELLEKAGPLGTVASKALAAKTQGSLSVARSQKSEAEKTKETSQEAPQQKQAFGQYKGYTPQTLSKEERERRKGGAVARAMDEKMFREQDERRGIKHEEDPTTGRWPIKK